MALGNTMSPYVQKCFIEQATELHCEFARQGNPFEDAYNEIAHLYSKHLPSKDVHLAVLAESKGEVQYHTFVLQRLVQRSVPISAPIKANNLPLPGNAPKVKKMKPGKSAKEDVHLLGRL